MDTFQTTIDWFTSIDNVTSMGTGSVVAVVKWKESYTHLAIVRWAHIDNKANNKRGKAISIDIESR